MLRVSKAVSVGLTFLYITIGVLVIIPKSVTLFEFCVRHKVCVLYLSYFSLKGNVGMKTKWFVQVTLSGSEPKNVIKRMTGNNKKKNNFLHSYFPFSETFFSNTSNIKNHIRTDHRK